MLHEEVFNGKQLSEKSTYGTSVTTTKRTGCRTIMFMTMPPQWAYLPFSKQENLRSLGGCCLLFLVCFYLQGDAYCDHLITNDVSAFY